MSYKITFANITKAKYCHLCTEQHSTSQLLPMIGYQEVLLIITTFYLLFEVRVQTKGKQTSFFGTKLSPSVSPEASIKGSGISYTSIWFTLKEISVCMWTKFPSVLLKKKTRK